MDWRDALAVLAVAACFVLFGIPPIYVWIPTPGWSERERVKRWFS